MRGEQGSCGSKKGKEEATATEEWGLESLKASGREAEKPKHQSISLRKICLAILWVFFFFAAKSQPCPPAVEAMGKHEASFGRSRRHVCSAVPNQKDEEPW